MRTIMFYANEFDWNSAAMETDTEPQVRTSQKDAVVVFVHAEPGDDDVERKTVTRFLKQLKQIARKWETKNIVLYPFSHLGEEKADMATAKGLIEQAASRLTKVNYSVKCTAFGRFIDFRMDSPGAQLSRAYRQY